MKKTLFVLFLISFCNLLIFAKPSKKSAKKAKPAVEVVEAVEAVAPVEPAVNEEPEIPEYEENEEFDEAAFEKAENIESYDYTATNDDTDNSESSYESEITVETDEEGMSIAAESEATVENVVAEETTESLIGTESAEAEPGESEIEYVLEGSENEFNYLRQYNRKFEVGFKTTTGVSNNFFSVKEFMKEELVIDFDEMADDMPDEGLCIDFLLNSGFYANLNLKNGWHFGTTTGIESSGHLTIGKELFDLMADGFELYKPVNVTGDATGDMFAYTDFEVGWNIKGFHLEVKPSLFHPLFHAETDNMYVTYNNPYDGSMSVAAVVDYTVYGFTELEPFFETDFGSLSLGSDLCKGWGFDLSATLEHKIIDSLQGGIYLRTPIVPGQLNYSAKVSMSAKYEVDGLKTILKGESKEAEFDSGTKVYGSADYYLNRPFRFGAQIAWRPLGNWCTFGASAGLGVDHPFTEGTKAYAEYELSYEAWLFHMFGARIASAYNNQIFAHQAAFMFNFRVFEMDLGVSIQGSDFGKSFKGSGAGAYINFAFGF